MIHEKMREIFDVPNEDETRLWQRYMTNSHELLTNENQTVSDAGIYGGQVHLHEHIIACTCVQLKLVHNTLEVNGQCQVQ